MPSEWSAGSSYAPGTTVSYEGTNYRVLQSHTSQSDWTPPIVPALFIPQSGAVQPTDQHLHTVNDTVITGPKPSSTVPAVIQFPVPHPAHPPTVLPPHESTITSDLREPVTLSTSLPDSKESWLGEARARTDLFNANGARSPATWLLKQSNGISSNAIKVGDDTYICRAFVQGHIVVGQVQGASSNVGVFGVGGQVVSSEDFEILDGDMYGLRWVQKRGALDPLSLGYRAIEAGVQQDGKPLPIVVAEYQGCAIPGNAGGDLPGASIVFRGTEVSVDSYCVLCYV